MGWICLDRQTSEGTCGVSYYFRINERDAAEALVKAHHYSRRWPANVQVVGTWHEAGGLFGDRGECVAACAFSIPPTRWSVELWELCRLVRAPHVREPLTGLIGATCDHIRRRKLMELLVSFADATQKHHGGIYQAASWQYAGQRESSMDGVIIDGTFKPGRSCNSTWGTRSPDKLRALMPGRVIEPHYDEGKHLYWRALSKAGRKKAATLGLAQMAYPKPNAQAGQAA
jgi:hypothetical protein